jgi:hypothetical protein
MGIHSVGEGSKVKVLRPRGVRQWQGLLWCLAGGHDLDIAGYVGADGQEKAELVAKAGLHGIFEHSEPVPFGQKS